MILAAQPAAVLTLGDNQYHVGSLSDFKASFDPSWGRVKQIIHPAGRKPRVLHGGARGYFDYFNGPGDTAVPPGIATRATTASTSAPGT